MSNHPGFFDKDDDMRSFGTTIDNLIDEELAYGASDYELVWYKNEELVEIHTSKLRFHFGGPKIPIGNITKDYIEIETDYMDFYKGDAIRIEMKKGEQSISVGPFYVDKFTKKKKASYVAYSSLLDLAQIKLTKYESDLSYAYIKDMVAYYMTPLGISFEPTNCPHINKAYIIDKWETFTMYDLAEAVALTDACNFTLQGNVLRKKNVNGSIAKVYKSKDVVYTDGKSKYEEDTYLDSIKMNYTSYYFSLEGLNCEEATYVVAPYGTQDNTLELNFKFIPYANTIDIVTQFYDDVIEDKVLLNDYEVPFLGDPRIEVGDVISFESEDGTVCTFRVGELVWEWDGGLKCIASTGSVTTNQSSAGGFTSIQQMADALVSMSNSLMTVRYNAVYTNELYANVADLGFASVEELSAEVAKMGLMTAEEADIKYMTVSSADMKYATIDLSNIKAGTITNAMIANGAIGTAQIADGSITDAKIVGLTANKITAGTLDAATIEVVNLNAANITVGTINGQQISKGTISLNNLASDVTDKLAATEEDVAQAVADAKQAVLDSASATATANTANSNTSTALSTANSAKTIADEVDSTVSDWSYDDDRQYINGAVLYTGTVVANAIAVGAIVSDKIASSAVTATKIASGAISTDKLAANAVTAAKIASGTITATQIAASTITGAKIAGETITATNIASSAITTDKIVASAVTAAKIATGAITTDKLAANAVTAAKIAAGTITATQIAASTITAAKMNVTSLSAISANLGTVTAGVIKSTNYVADSAGMKLDLSTGVWDSKNTKIAKDGAITCSNISITGGNIALTATSYDNAKITVSYDIHQLTISPGAMKVSNSELETSVSLNSGGSVYVGKTGNFVQLSATAQSVANIHVGSPTSHLTITGTDVITSDGISLRGLNSNLVKEIHLLNNSSTNSWINIGDVSSYRIIEIIVFDGTPQQRGQCVVGISAASHGTSAEKPVFIYRGDTNEVIAQFYVSNNILYLFTYVGYNTSVYVL